MSKRDLINELHKPARKHFKRRRVITKGIDDLWQADLVDMSAYARVNRGFHFLLTVIDTFSKYAWVVPCKNKNAESVTNAMAEIFKTKSAPRHLQTDDGLEFFNSNFAKLMKKHKINHYSVFTHLKASICER